LQPANPVEKSDAAATAQPAKASPPPTTGGPPVPPAAASPPTPDTTRTRGLAEQIVAKFPSTKVDYTRERRLKVTVPPEEMRAVALFVRDVLGFDHLNVVGGTDYMQQQQFEVIYFVGSLSTPGQQDLVVQLAERVKRDDSPKVPSLTEVWVAAEYHERETYEMLGIVFEGHPDLRRLLLPEDWNDIPPLRKDYVSPGR
jgi:NADH:ubiquinone oxidoreductase subunit C